MAKKLFLVDIDLNGNQLLNGRVQNLATAPGSPTSGLQYFDTATNTFKGYNGTSWVPSLGGSVTNVSGNGAISVTNGTTTPSISIAAASTSAPGTMSAADKLYLDSVPAALSAKAPLASPVLTGYPKVQSGVLKSAGNGTDSVFSVVDSTGTTGLSSTLFDVKTNGDCIIGGVITVRGTGESTFAGDVNIGGKLTVAQTATASAAIAGTDLTLTGNLVVLGNTTLGDAAADTLTVNATSMFKSPVTKAAGNSAINALSVMDSTGSTPLFEVRQNGDVKVGNNLTVSGTGGSTFSDSLTLDGNLTVKGDTTLGDASTDTITINGTTQVKSPTTKAGGSGSINVFSIVDSATTGKLFEVRQNGDTIIGGVLTVNGTGTSTFAGDVSIGGKLTVADTATATADLSGTDLTLTGNLVVHGNTTLGDAGTDTLTVVGTVALPSTTSIGNVSSTEIGYLDGVTSAIQTQLGASNLLTQIKTVDGTTSGLDADLLDGQHGTYYLGRAAHTGTQTSSTISDFDTSVRTSRLDQMAAPTSAVSLNGQRITSLSTPSAGTDAVNKDYVDAARAGLSVKDPVRVASTANVVVATGTLLTIDGVTLVAGDRVLLKNQTTASQNGIYIAATGAWARSSDTDTSGEMIPGSAVWVNEGTSNGDSRWVLTTNAPITLGTTALTFTKDFQAADVVAGAGLTKSGSTLDVIGTANRITVGADNVDIASTYAGQTSITTLGTISAGTWAATDVAVLHGGTGASDAAGAKTNLGFMTRYSTNNLVATAGQVISYTHSLNTLDVLVQVYSIATGEEVEFDIKRTGVNTISLSANQALTAGTYRIVVIG